jgi:hypothetical protein
MKRLLTRLREEPALIGTGLSVLMAVGAAFGLDITDAQRDALLGLAGFMAMVGFGIRSKVTPVAKIEREAKEDREPRAARLRPHLRGDE